VRAKTRKAPEASIRYLLQVDPTLRRVSLTRVATRARKTAKATGTKEASSTKEVSSSKRVARGRRRTPARPRVRPYHVVQPVNVPAAEHVARHEVETPAQTTSRPAADMRPQATVVSTPAARTELVARASRAARPAPVRSAARPWVIAGALALVGTAVLVAAHRPARQDDFVSAVDAVYRQPAPDLLAAPARTSVQPPAPAVAPAPASSTAPKQGATLSSSARKTDAAPARTIDAAAVAASAPVLVAASVSAPEPVKATSRPEPEAPVLEAAADAPTSISGCLERDDDTFVLKNTSGAEAPKSRSWKTGFLKKHSVAIELLDASGGLKLQRYVGQRVTATGTLTNREMRPRSVKPASGSCG
jgi:hypothetical protein